jgi:hypothetical protein
VRRRRASGKARLGQQRWRHPCPAGRLGRRLGPSLERLERLVLLANVTWVSTQSGFWDVASNWSTGAVPGAGDDVTINQPGNITVTVEDSREVGSVQASSTDTLAVNSTGSLVFGSNSLVSNLDGGLDLAGGSFRDESAGLVVRGSSQWTGGSFFPNSSGTTIASTGTVSVSGAQPTTLLNPLINTGMVIIGAGAGLAFNEGNLTNQSTGTVDFQSDAGFSGTGSFINAGTLTKSAGTGTSIIGVFFQNQGGTIDANSGTLSIAGGGSSTGGTLNAMTGGTLDLTGGSSNNTLAGSYTGSGGGQVLLATGQLDIDEANGATFDFAPGLFQMNSSAASNPAAYQLLALAKTRKKGSRSGKPVGLASATYSATTDSVALIPRGKFPSQTLQLDINATLVIDASNQPLGAGHDYKATITPGGAVTPSAIDALLPSGNGGWIKGLRQGR